MILESDRGAEKRGFEEIDGDIKVMRRSDSIKGLMPNMLDLARTMLSAFTPVCLRDWSLITPSCVMFFFVSVICHFNLIPCDKTVFIFFSPSLLTFYSFMYTGKIRYYTFVNVPSDVQQANFRL